METTPARQRLIEALSAAHSTIDSSLSQSLSGSLGISYSEFRLLSALAGAPNRAASRVDIAAAVGLTPSGVTRALKPLEKIGMVDSTKNERDARQTLATLTRSGLRTVTDGAEIINDKLSVLFDRAPSAAANLDALAAMLEELSGR